MEDSWIKYAEEFTSPEGDVLRSLARECYANYSNHSMLSGFFQGRVLSMLSKMIQPKVVLEIGTYLGYSALCFAEGLAEGGKVITLDVDEATHKVAKSFVAKSPFADRIEFHLGPATGIIPTLPETFDLVFIDADKQNNPEYFQWALKLARVGSLIIIDNVVRDGTVIDADKNDPSIAGVRRLNEMLGTEPRVSATALQTVGSKGYDGFALAVVLR